ncbi:hypothetical protein BX070DRAFT_226542 [Coemansia spiralis]|nr:hypothetical protein BX070DRAFT_226542 [Coemansia spiralis]KAJ1987198.1 hypothetical protein EDC05_005963 [Coemansia umbellata]
MSSPSLHHHQHHHRPYELQPSAPASRTFWNHYETGLLVQLWLEFEPQFLANKRNAGVWAQLAQRLTERSGRHRTVRECRIKWKNMWAKHRDLANASHMSLEAKLREFPHFSHFSAIRQRSSQQHSLPNEGSEGKLTPSEDDRRMPSIAASASLPSISAEPTLSSTSAHAPPNTSAAPRWGHRELPAAAATAVGDSTMYNQHHHRHHNDQAAYSSESPPIPATRDIAEEHHSRFASNYYPRDEDSPKMHSKYTAGSTLKTLGSNQSSLASILTADPSRNDSPFPEINLERGQCATPKAGSSYTHSKEIHPTMGPQAHCTPASSLANAVSSMAMEPAATTGMGSLVDAMPQEHSTSIYDIPTLLRRIDSSSSSSYAAIDIVGNDEGEEYSHHHDNRGSIQYHRHHGSNTGNQSKQSRSPSIASVDSMIERMKMLASTSSSTDISNAAQQIMGYVERESKRRQMQSERHHRIVIALAEILSRSSASSTAAPSTSTSRRSSGLAHEQPSSAQSQHPIGAPLGQKHSTVTDKQNLFRNALAHSYPTDSSQAPQVGSTTLQTSSRRRYEDDSSNNNDKSVVLDISESSSKQQDYIHNNESSNPEAAQLRSTSSPSYSLQYPKKTPSIAASEQLQDAGPDDAGSPMDFTKT